LGANQLRSENNPMKWKTETNYIIGDEQEYVQPVEIQDDVINVTLKPMEIRTFILKVKRRAL